MKKLLILLILLLIIGGVVFFFGWIQILIPPGCYAVIHTKTGGYEEKVIPAGVFAWRIERLLPTNMTIYLFRVEPREVETTEIQGTLPSGDVYSAFLDGNPDFSFRLKASVLVSLNTEVLPSLVAEEGLKPETLDEWYEIKVASVLQRLASDIRENAGRISEVGYFEHLKDRLALDPEFASLKIERIVPMELILPDQDLYNEAKRQYLSLAKARETKDIVSIQQEKSNLKVLKEYAELLTQYPVLLKYLYLQNLKGKNLDILNLDLPSFSEEAE
jgi:hypothetical protein